MVDIAINSYCYLAVNKFVLRAIEDVLLHWNFTTRTAHARDEFAHARNVKIVLKVCLPSFLQGVWH